MTNTVVSASTAVDWCASTYHCQSPLNDDVALRRLLQTVVAAGQEDNPAFVLLANTATCPSMASAGLCIKESWELLGITDQDSRIGYARMIRAICGTACNVCNETPSTSPSPSPTNSPAEAPATPSPSSSTAPTCLDSTAAVVKAAYDTSDAAQLAPGAVTNCASITSVSTFLGTLNLCTRADTKAFADEYCPVTCNSCPNRRRRQLSTTSPPANRGDFTLSSSGCTLQDQVEIMQHTTLSIRGDRNSITLPIITPASPTSQHRLFLTRGVLILEYIQLKGGSVPVANNGMSRLHDCRFSSLDFFRSCSGGQVYVGDTIGGFLTTNIATLKATDAVFIEAGVHCKTEGICDVHYRDIFGGAIGAMGAVGNIAGEESLFVNINQTSVILNGTTIKNNYGGAGGGIAVFFSILTLRGGRNRIQKNDAVAGGKNFAQLGSTVEFTVCEPGKYYMGSMVSLYDPDVIGCPSTCEIGTFAPKEEKRVGSCPNCPSGHYCPNILESPVPCPSGRYNKVDKMFGQYSCLPCENGMYSTNKGASQCYACVPGKYSDQQALNTCKGCAQNKYAEDEGRTNCTICPLGWTSNIGATTQCIACVPGKFASLESKVCDNCPIGYLQPDTGKPKCNPVPAGQIVAAGGSAAVTVPLGSKICTSTQAPCDCEKCVPFIACKAGTIGNEPPTTTCVSCQAGFSSVNGAIACIPCAKGKYSAEEGSVCHDCGVGKYQEQSLQPSTTCLDCPAGYVQKKLGESSCVAIPGIRILTKLECARRFLYLNTTQHNPQDWTCEACPAGAWCGSESGGTTQDDIVALYGWYRLRNRTLHHPPVFRKCPMPFACLGKPNEKEFGKDYQFAYLWENFTATTAKKNIAEAEKCNAALGYAPSLLCTGCLPHYSHSAFSNIDQCSLCPDEMLNALVLALLALLLFIVVIVMMFLKFRSAKHPKIKAAHSTLKRIVLSHMQIIGVVMSLDVPWPRSLLDLIGIFSSAVSLEGRMQSGTRCSSAQQDTPSSVTLYATTMVLAIGPILVAFCTYLYWRFVALNVKQLRCNADLTLNKVKEGTRKKAMLTRDTLRLDNITKANYSQENTSVRSRKKKSIVGDIGQTLQLTPFDATVATMTLLLYLMYPSITASTFSMMKCESVTNTVRPHIAKEWVVQQIVLTFDRDEICWEGRHLSYTIFVSIPVLILYTFGMPFSGLFILFRRREKLQTSQNTVFRFGLLYSGYAGHRWWWESITTLRKLLVVMCATFLTGDAMQLQILLGFVFGMIGVNAIGKPFNNHTKVGDELALVEGASLGLLFVTVWSGMFFLNFNHAESSLSDDTNYSLDSTCNGNISCDFLVFFVIMLNVTFLLLALRRLFVYFEERTHIVMKAKKFVRKTVFKNWGIFEDENNEDGRNEDERSDEGGEVKVDGDDHHQWTPRSLELTTNITLATNPALNIELEKSVLKKKSGKGKDARGKKEVKFATIEVLVDKKTKDADNEGKDAGGGVWERFYDESSGDWFECHSVTEETRWVEDDDEGTVNLPGL